MYRIPRKIRSTHGRDGAVVLDIREGRMFNLNFVASRILKHLESGLSQPTIVEEIIREFEVSRELAENDVHEFLHTLRKYQLLQTTD